MNPILRPGRIRTAVLLAAGRGSRLFPLTDTAPKCLTEVNGVPILEQQIRCLEHWGFERLIIVVGYQHDQIREFVARCAPALHVTYVHNRQFRETNNLYSLWLARKVIDRSFVLLESDLFFEPELLSGMLQPDRIALAAQQPWMNGTTVTLDSSHRVVEFHMGGTVCDDPSGYKTVNIYSLSLDTWRRMERQLDAYVVAGRVSEYYEAVFAQMAAEGEFSPRITSFDKGLWYEIDTLEDLRIAEDLFARAAAPPKPGLILPLVPRLAPDLPSV